MSNIIFEEERRYYPALNACVYVNHAVGGLIPTYSRDAMLDYIHDYADNPSTMEKFIAYWKYCDDARAYVARLFGCSASEITYGLSHSWLFNIFTNGIGLRNGDNIITTENSHSSVNYICMHQRGKGVTTRFVKPREGRYELEDILTLVDEKTKAICLCYVENKTGFRHDLRSVGEFCRKNGIFLAVDATQAAGVLKIDVREMKVDFLTTSCYKWMQGIYGVGFAYVSRELLPLLEQPDMGWTGSKDRHHLNPLVLNLSEDANKFECGNINTVGIIGVSKVIERYLALGAEEIEKHVMSLVNYFYEEAKTLKKFRIYGDYAEKHRSSVITLHHPADLEISNQSMERAGIVAHCYPPELLRLGFHYCNNRQDVDKLLKYFHSFD
jgi:selenocysteine lyase/cysteine desulfurase